MFPNYSQPFPKEPPHHIILQMAEISFSGHKVFLSQIIRDYYRFQERRRDLVPYKNVLRSVWDKDVAEESRGRKSRNAKVDIMILPCFRRQRRATEEIFSVPIMKAGGPASQRACKVFNGSIRQHYGFRWSSNSEWFSGAQEIRRLRWNSSAGRPHLMGSDQEPCCGQTEAGPDEDRVLGDGVLPRARNECCQEGQVLGTAKD